MELAVTVFIWILVVMAGTVAAAFIVAALKIARGK